MGGRSVILHPELVRCVNLEEKNTDDGSFGIKICKNMEDSQEGNFGIQIFGKCQNHPKLPVHGGTEPHNRPWSPMGQGHTAIGACPWIFFLKNTIFTTDSTLSFKPTHDRISMNFMCEWLHRLLSFGTTLNYFLGAILRTTKIDIKTIEWWYS